MVIMELTEQEKEGMGWDQLFKYKVVRHGLMLKVTFEHKPKGSKRESLVGGYMGDKHSGQIEQNAWPA